MRCNERARYRVAAWLVFFRRGVGTAGREARTALPRARSGTPGLRYGPRVRPVHAGIVGALGGARRTASMPRRRLVAWRRGGIDLGEAGPAPGAAGCVDRDNAVLYQPARLAVCDFSGGAPGIPALAFRRPDEPAWALHHSAG